MRIFRFIYRLTEFMIYFAWELVLSNLRVTYDVLRPVRYLRPGVIAVPIELQTAGEITMLANVVSLTPGTLTLDVSTDRKVLYVHGMQIEDAERLRQTIKSGFERRVRGLFE